MDPSDVASTDFYERLGVPRDASPEDIKLAYVDKVREYPPERHAEEFQRIREAYETLSDPESRAEYDATSDPAVEESLEKGQDALQNEDYETAAACFKRALVLQPEAHFIRNLLGITYLHEEANAQALEQFERLTKEMPDNYLYWAHLATAEHGLEHWESAERHYQKAIELEPEETGPYQGMAALLADRERFSEAEQLLEEAIHADGVVDFEDISLFFEMVTLKLRQGDVEAIERVSERIVDVVTEDWQRTRVAYRFATLAQPLVEFQAFELALTLAETSEQLAPDDTEIAQFTEYIRQNRAIIEEWEQLSEDSQVRDNVKALYAIALQGYFDTWQSESDRQSSLEQIHELLVQESVTAVVADGRRRQLSDEFEYVDENYPDVAQVLSPEYRDQFRQMGTLVGGATHVWLTCPHCWHKARAQDETGRYTCPACNKSFDYEKSKAQVEKWSAGVQAQGCAGTVGSFIGYGILGLLFLGMVQSC